MNKIIISLGGSIVSTQPDQPALRAQYAQFLVELAKQNVVAVIVGGGYRARKDIENAKAVDMAIRNDQLDQIGINATIANADVMRALCQVSHPLIDPHFVLPGIPGLLFGAGWIPGRSTDYDAVLLAVNNGVDMVFNLSNISKIYSADPKQDPTAKPLDDITWAELRHLVGDTWTPGLNMPFDPIAAQLAEQHQLTVHVMHGKDLENVAKAVHGEAFAGTVIHS